jgi:signal transduction histidine kinase
MLKNPPSKLILFFAVFAVSVVSLWIDLGRIFGGYSSLFMISILFVGISWQHRHSYFLLSLLGTALLLPGTLIDHPSPILEERATAVILIWLIALLLSYQLWRTQAYEKGLNQQLGIDASKVENELLSRTNAEENLSSAEDIAQALKQENDRLIARIGHELRTPLNNIIGFSELILSGNIREKNPEKLNEYITDIHDSGNMLLEFIDNMVDSTQLQIAIQHQGAEYNSLIELAPDLICECENGNIIKIGAVLDNAK